MLNDGIDWSSGDNVYWKNDVHRFEALKIILHGNAEFEANNVTIQVICDNNRKYLAFIFISIIDTTNPVSSFLTLYGFKAP